eukprot:TRINITY_DN5509_c0_g1_i5.p1 TRINITY_DN5509_c0_g1~~TRINITY_DN5509_c0_g1_i5.p1  ORF type:complete len:540 (+),score=98.13 TRINITY_DN5509_c0_g1_i5:153-1622(+)
MTIAISRLALLAIVGLLASTIVLAAPSDESDSSAPSEGTDTPATNTTKTDETAPKTPAANTTTTEEDKSKEEQPKKETEKEKPKSEETPETPKEDKNDTKVEEKDSETPAETTPETTADKNATNSTSSERKLDGDGYYEDYEDYFDFEDLFTYEEGYERYFDDDYFSLDYGMGGDGDYYDGGDTYDDYYSYNDYMYQGLYDDYYYGDYYYDTADYYDYEYYGDYGYYGVYNEEGELYNMYNDYDDYEYLYDYFQFDEDKCDFNDKGEIVFNASMNVCDVKIEGADKHVKNLEGGIDGVYQLAGCHNNRPKYVRYEPAKQERVLWFSTIFGDWDIGLGTEADEQDIIIYGGDGLDEERPNFVSPQSWAIAADIVSDDEERLNLFEDYLSIDLTVSCSDGKTLDRPERSTMGKMPLLTDDEMESQYRMIYDKYGNKKPEPSINFAMVVVIVFVGMGVVLGLPYMLARRTDKQGKTMWRRYQEEQKKRVGKD